MKCTFSEIWVADFEFRQPDGELPEIRCMVATEARSGKTFRLWKDSLEELKTPPFSIGENSLFVAYYSTAELNCFRAIGWSMPQNILDLYVEFKRKYCGRMPPARFNLLGALYAYDLPEVIEKDEMRALSMRAGSKYSENEKRMLLDYCSNDVSATTRLLWAMWPELDLPRALLRGRYMAGVSAIETTGVPIDVNIFNRLSRHWDDIRSVLIGSVDADYGVYEGTTFKLDRFETYLRNHNINWPRLYSGTLDLKRDTFREMARAHSIIAPLHELRHTLSDLRINRLAVGSDGRNRCLLSPFGAKTARNLPSNAKFIFGPSTWLRSLIKPKRNMAVAYIDYSQQEFAIAAVLSGDTVMQEAYLSGDPYLKFGKQAGVIPEIGTKDTHPEERKLFKECALGVQYGMGANSLARRIGRDNVAAHVLIETHKKTYKQYWKWSEAVVNHGLLHGELVSTLGWRISIGANPNVRMLANWPIQTNGSEILRVAIMYLTETDIKVCAPVHDAVLIEAPIDRIEADVEKARGLMQKAGQIILQGFDLRTDVEVVRYPDRYVDDRGVEMWSRVVHILESIESD